MSDRPVPQWVIDSQARDKAAKAKGKPKPKPKPKPNA